jgi:hypothetical protein
MITNTCFTAGSFAPAVELEPTDPPLPELELGAEGAGEVGGDFEEAAGALPFAAGVGSDSAAGGSLELAGEGLSAPGVDVAPGMGACARITFTGRRAEAARTPVARERTALPTITPNPRNISTSKVDIRGEGSVGPDPRRAGASGGCAASSSGRPEARTRRRSATS